MAIGGEGDAHMKSLIEKICRKEGLRPQKIKPLSGGQVNQVYRIDEEYVLRIGARENAFQRLQRETELIRGLPPELPVPKIVAFGEQEGIVYQIQQFIPGQKLSAAWKDLPPLEQENIVAELAAFLKILHGRAAQSFGYLSEEVRRQASWADYLTEKFDRTLQELDALRIRMVPGFVELAGNYFAEHQGALRDALPVLVHGDLTFMNILVRRGKISALLDFEYAMQAPTEYELRALEDFCLYPNDYVEDDQPGLCAGDFAGFFQLLRKHDPRRFEVPRLRERMNLYHLDATLSSYLAWRKDNLGAIPVEKMAAKEFYMARITNFIFRNGTRLF
jgi:aminoglycoside phosphotransferase (APT) family kinase protein